jgi:predicted dehydrogenase
MEKNMKDLKIAVIGYGYWGPNLVRNFTNLENSTVSHVVDESPDRLEKVKKLYPSINATSSLTEILENPEIDCIIIATPISTHYDIAKKALEHNKHVLVEKPMTNSVKHAKELIELSKKKKKVLMVDHTYLYTGAIQKIKKIIDKNMIGEIQYIDSTRINLGLFQPDVNVLWDLAAHDISICSYLMNENPISVQAMGKSHTDSDFEDIAYLTLHFKSKKIIHFNCSWISPVKIRYMLIGGNKKMIIFNDLETTEKVKIYDTKYKTKTNPKNDRQILADYRVGDIFIPKLTTREGLSSMVEDFVSAIIDKTKPISNYDIGLQVVKILEAAQRSITNQGKEVKI